MGHPLFINRRPDRFSFPEGAGGLQDRVRGDLSVQRFMFAGQCT